MQTFLPFADFEKSAEVLDYRRLGKQRVEAMQIFNVLNSTEPVKPAWSNHAAVLMWKGYEGALAEYHNVIITEWIKRGYKNNMLFIIYEPTDKNGNFIKQEYPWWLGNEAFHRSHKARLIDKNEEFYLPKFPNDKGFNDGKYFWPVNDTKTFKVI